MTTHSFGLVAITADIVSSFVNNQTLRVSEIPDLIFNVHASLNGLMVLDEVKKPLPRPKPAVSIKKSISEEYIICLDDGQQFRSLKRHLRQLGMTPDEYRSKWGLASNYPMVAPGYAAKRSELARAAGLGQSRQKPISPAPIAPDLAANYRIPAKQNLLVPAIPEPASTMPEPIARRRGRPKKAA